MANKRYTKEFKDSTVQLALNGNKPIIKVGEDLGVNPKTIHNWIREYKLKNNIKTDNRRNKQKTTIKETEHEENIRLRAENKILREERDILKKATAPQGHFLASLTARTLQRKFCKVCVDTRESKELQYYCNV